MGLAMNSAYTTTVKKLTDSVNDRIFETIKYNGPTLLNTIEIQLYSSVFLFDKVPALYYIIRMNSEKFPSFVSLKLGKINHETNIMVQ